MTRHAVVHPDYVLKELLAKARTLHQRKLRALHAICQRQYAAGEHDFSLTMIGRQCDRDFALNSRSLYGANSIDYRALIAAWAAFAGSNKQLENGESSADKYTAWLKRIADPALKALLQATITQRNQLQTQLNTLTTCNRQMDGRQAIDTNIPRSADHTPPSISHSKSVLTDAEKQALRLAISDQELQNRGWQMTALGDILDARGIVLFNRCFLSAIHKILNHE